MALAGMLVAGTAQAAGTSFDGVSGLLRVQSASPSATGYVSATVYGLVTREYYTRDQSIRSRDEVIKYGAGRLSLGYAASPYVELAVSGLVEGQLAHPEIAGEDRAVGISDVALSVKTLLTPAQRRDWMLGVGLSVATATGDDGAFTGSWDSEGVDIAGRLALSYSHLRADQRPDVRFHLNAGYLNRTGSFDEVAWAMTRMGPTPARSVLHGDQFLYGAGIEIPVPNHLTFFAERSGEHDIDSPAEFKYNPMRVTPGIRLHNRSGSFVWTNGVELSVADELSGPTWQVVSGLTFGGFVAPVQGGLLGIVRDSETGEPIAGARIGVRNSVEDPVVADADGRFRKTLDEGYAVLELSAEGYNAKTRVVEIKGHETEEFDFTMMRRNVFGGVRGRIRDRETGNPLFGRVRVTGTERWVETDPATGAYVIERVNEGEVDLEFEARNYMTATRSTKILAGEMVAQDISLSRDLTATMGVLSGYVHDLKTGKSIPATVTARGKTTQTASVDPTTGLYELELEAGTYNLSVTSPGHIAQVESVVIEETEAAVRNFHLGILPQKMTLKGVYFDSGTASIKQDSYTTLAEAAKFLLDNPTVRVVIEGHTDSQGSLSTNLALSQRRADAVMKYLVVNHGVEPSRLSAKGLGPNHPIASNDNRDGRALNRRIEFSLLDRASKQ
jgi:outer membrane protein OmpA-like peptidoglycan-associated protein